MSKKPKEQADELQHLRDQVELLKRKLVMLEKTRTDQVAELMRQLEEALSDIADLLVRSIQ